MNTKHKSPTSSAAEPNLLGEVIKLGIDVHIEKYVVVMKIAGSVPARAKRFTPEPFIGWVQGLTGRCEERRGQMQKIKIISASQLRIPTTRW